MNARVLFCTVITLLIGIATPAAAQQPDSWSLRVGAGILVSPAYSGSSTYQVSALPALRIAYGDQFFASVEEGIGYAFTSGPLSAGPLVRIAFGRKEDGSSPFRLLGKRTNELRGLGDVPTTAEAGGFLRYRIGNWSAGAELRQGAGGHNGMVGEINVSHRWRFNSPIYSNGAPAIISLGPSITFANQRYLSTFFGISPSQAAGSGLSTYSSGGGIVSYGAGGVAIVPVSERVAVSLLLNYQHLGREASRSPLVVQHGSSHQLTSGIFATYQFVWD